MHGHLNVKYMYIIKTIILTMCGLNPPISFQYPTAFLHLKCVHCASLQMSHSSPHVFGCANFSVRFMRLKPFMFLVTGQLFYVDYDNRNPPSPPSQKDNNFLLLIPHVSDLLLISSSFPL